MREAAPGAADAFFSLELNRSTAAAWRSITVARRLRRAAYRDQGSAPPSAPTQRAASAWTPSRDGSDKGWRANGSRIFALSVSLDTVIQSAAFANALARRCACRCATFSNTSTSLLLASLNCLSGTKRGTYVDELSSTRTASTDTCARRRESSASASASRTCGTRSSLQISRTWSAAAAALTKLRNDRAAASRSVASSSRMIEQRAWTTGAAAARASSLVSPKSAAHASLVVRSAHAPADAS